ncbi:MAG: c-type cytochrome domain-containing protein [Candidatus Hinthialibacter antarcticus]|nr:c-type cytochrome domain-containing protein [Candidatus Hinthialibacter antarcticus]
MKNYLIALFLLALIAAPLGFSIDFEQDVEPILMANCVGCHAKNDPAAGLQLLSVETILKGGAKHKVVSPGKPDESLMLQVVVGKAEPKMPPKPLLPLEPDDVAIIREWIASLGVSEKVEEENETPASLKDQPKDDAKKNSTQPDTEILDDVFAGRIHPILQSNCLGCHGAENPKAKLDLTSFSSITNGSRKGKVIEPGKPKASVLFQRIAQLDGAKPMPPKPMAPLSDDDIEAVRDWIAAMGKSAPKVEPTSEDVADELLDAPIHNYEHDEIGAVAFHPSEPILAVGKLHRVELYRFDAETKQLNLIHTLAGHSSLVRALRFSPDGQSLAAAGGRPALDGEVIVWDMQTHQQKLKLKGHDDCIYDIEYSPDGATLATCSYDRAIKLWDAKSGEETKTLLDHVDAVYAIAFSPDGSRIASAAGDRTIKIWDAQYGKRIFTLSEPLNAQYAVAFHPDGVHLAAAGADKIIRVWELGETRGKLVESKFSHDGAVLDLFYSHSGETLFSTAEDRLVKAWRGSDFQEQQVWGPQPDWVLSLASDSNESLLAMGCYDGTLRLYDVNSGERLVSLDETPKDIQAEISQKKITEDNSGNSQDVQDGDPFRVRVVKGNGTYLSALSYIETRAFIRGASHTVRLHGKNLDDALVLPDDDDISIRVTNVEVGELADFKRAEFTTAAEIVDTGLPYVLTLEIAIGENAREGVHHMWAQTPLATTNMVTFAVEGSAPVKENEESDSLTSAPWLEPPCIAAGAIGEVGDVDPFRIKAKVGDEYLFDVMAGAIGSGLAASLEIVDEEENVLASGSGRIGYRFERDGDYGVRVQDANLRKGGFYRLHVNEKPLVESVFPLGAQKGATAQFSFAGYNLGEKTVEVKVPETDEDIRNWNPFPFSKPNLALSEFPEVIEVGENRSREKAISIDTPCIVNGRIYDPSREQDEDWYRFEAKQGERLAIAVEAQQLGSTLDSIIDVFDAEGKPIEIAAVRCVAETFLTLSDRDSRSRGMRLDSWTDLTINDYMMVGDEVLQVVKLPDYPDEDVLFAGNARFGWRYGLFGTTPAHHAVFAPAYKVEIHPPGTAFSPNGMPVFRLYARNDDGGAPTYRKDSYLVFDPPKDGAYYVRISDAMQQSGPEFAYRLHVRPPQPDYKIYVDNSRLNVHQGGRYPLSITADRIEGFDAPIEVRVRNLPDGFSATSSVILPGEESCSITLWAIDGAETTAWNDDFVVEARSTIDGEEVVRESHINQLSVVRPADVTITQQPEVIRVRPGESVKCTVKIKRSNGFSGRVPIDVRNLPFGVYVMDTGLNGILVTENETERTYEIYVEPWVAPMERPFFSIASVETSSPLRHWNASNTSVLKIETPLQQAAFNLN